MNSGFAEGNRMSAELPRVVADLPVADAIAERLAGRVELLPWDFPGPADAVYTFGHPTVDGAFLDRLQNVRVISNYGVGVDHIDLEAARQRGIPVANTPGVLDGATADLAMALVLAVGRRVVEGDRYARGPHFLKFDPAYMLGQEIHGATLGIFGLGRIGEQVARRARGFDMAVLYHNRHRKPEAEQRLGVSYASKDELLTLADYVVLTLPLSPETRGFIGAAELAKMKPTACLVNVARGACVDTEALTAALRSRTILAAALDVTEPEPLPRNHPLLELDNVIITPHLGSATVQTRLRMAELSVDNLLTGLRGGEIRHRVV